MTLALGKGDLRHSNLWGKKKKKKRKDREILSK